MTAQAWTSAAQARASSALAWTSRTQPSPCSAHRCGSCARACAEGAQQWSPSSHVYAVRGQVCVLRIQITDKGSRAFTGPFPGASQVGGVWHRRPTIVGRLCETASPHASTVSICGPSRDSRAGEMCPPVRHPLQGFECFVTGGSWEFAFGFTPGFIPTRLRRCFRNDGGGSSPLGFTPGFIPSRLPNRRRLTQTPYNFVAARRRRPLIA